MQTRRDLTNAIGNIVADFFEFLGLLTDKVFSPSRIPWTLPKAGQRYESAIIAAAESTGVDKKILASMLYQESRFNPNAKSNKGAQGIAQLLAGTASEVGVTNRLDPEQSIFGGARYLSRMFDRFGDWRLALAAYNWGPGNVAKVNGDFSKLPPSVKRYATEILDRAQ